jgi:hypothetical protein
MKRISNYSTVNLSRIDFHAYFPDLCKQFHAKTNGKVGFSNSCIVAIFAALIFSASIDYTVQNRMSSLERVIKNNCWCCRMCVLLCIIWWWLKHDRSQHSAIFLHALLYVCLHHTGRKARRTKFFTNLYI